MSKKSKTAMSRAEFAGKVDPSDEVRHLRSEVHKLEAQIEKGRRDSGAFSEAMSAVLDAVPFAEPPTIKYSLSVDDDEKSRVVMVPHATDWHIGATTLPEYCEEFGEFNYSLAESRVKTWAQKIIDKTLLMRSSYVVDECVVLGTADWISGDIHEELVRTNEFPCPVQAVKSGFLLGEFLLTLAEHFPVVRAEILTAGNHDRVTRKPQSEMGALNSWGYVTTSIAQQYVSKCPSIKYNQHLGAKAVVDVNGTKYLLMHGDGIPAHMGVPHFGMDRLVMREFLARAKMLPERQFDAVVCGHWHVANNLMYCRYGGSLSGTTAHDHKYARHSPPHQTSWFVHEKHGELDWTRWWL
jgi:predicted phosphodiesterase